MDIDVSQALKYKLLVERKGFSFFVEIEYENILAYCTYCRLIGHHVDYCKRWHVADDFIPNNDNLAKKKPVREPKKVFVQIEDGRQEQCKSKEVVVAEKEVVNLEDDVEENLGGKTASDLQLVEVPNKLPEPAKVFMEQDLQLEA